MSQHKVERISEVGFCELMEGPHWDVEEQCLYYVDIAGHSIHKYSPGTKKHAKAILDGKTVSLIVPVQGQKDKFLISMDRDIVLVTWDGQSEKVSSKQTIASVEEDFPEGRINDGKCDESGRLWFGTMDTKDYTKKYNLFSLENGKAVNRLQGVMISNGLAWNSNNAKFFFIDSMTKRVDEFDYELSTGNISNRKELFSCSTTGQDLLPDGMTIDNNGNLWFACYKGSCVINIDSKCPNVLLKKIDLPAKQVTSVAFGGPNLDEFYVTTAKVPTDGVVLNPPEDGGLYKITGLGVKGLAAAKNAKI